MADIILRLAALASLDDLANRLLQPMFVEYNYGLRGAPGQASSTRSGRTDEWCRAALSRRRRSGTSYAAARAGGGAARGIRPGGFRDSTGAGHGALGGEQHGPAVDDDG